MEPLVEIPQSEWPHLINLFEAEWPKGASTSCLLNTKLSYPTFIEKFNFKVYAPDGDTSNGIIAIDDQFGWYEVIIRPLFDINKIEDALLSTKLIDWDREFIIPAADGEVENCMKRLCGKLKLKINFLDEIQTHILRKDSEQYKNLENPPKTYVAPLKPEYVKIVDETWTYHNTKTHKFFETLAKNDLAYVLYNSEDEKPLAWIHMSTDGSLAHWYCIESHRGHGYGEYIAKYAINDLLKKGFHVLAYTVMKNKVAQNLFAKLGFEMIGHVKWISFVRDVQFVRS